MYDEKSYNSPINRKRPITTILRLFGNYIVAQSERNFNTFGKLYEFSVKKCCPYLTTHLSGSPIIQDGKLVGAVTHVMVADPTEGYGIFIENMLSAAQGEGLPKAA